MTVALCGSHGAAPTAARNARKALGQQPRLRHFNSRRPRTYGSRAARFRQPRQDAGRPGLPRDDAGLEGFDVIVWLGASNSDRHRHTAVRIFEQLSSKISPGRAFDGAADEGGLGEGLANFRPRTLMRSL